MTTVRAPHSQKVKFLAPPSEDPEIVPNVFLGYGGFNKFEKSLEIKVWGEAVKERQVDVSGPSFLFDQASWAPLEEQAFTNLLVTKPFVRVEYASAIESHLREAFGQKDTLKDLNSKVEEIRRMLEAVLNKLNAFEPHGTGVFVPIETFALRRYEVLRPFTVVLIPSDEGFEACFYDANISSYGDTESEAIEGLKEILLDTFDRLNELKDDELGPGPKKQKEILNVLIRRVPH
jgi:hypothetical protein